MANMMLTAEEAKEYNGTCAPSEDAPKYPYGLALSLNDGSMKKLGITSLPAVGSTVRITAAATVTGVGMSQQQDGDAEQRVELQITDMDLAGAPHDMAKSLYGA